uniref:Uncharacterized protein n=1 Tax=Timema genevievae TaxID=629358 RepID=A0A7R9K3M9_TIMGE|nr:unnamed protein product [Timema genevievae]
MVDTSSCRFPSWTQGHWQYLYVEGNTLIYKDHHTFKTYTMRCLGSDSGAGERFLVFGRTQCGEEMYTCMWIKRRGMNVLEFQIGMERLQESPCPVAGEYAGYIPDATGLCAKLSSDCKSPEIMYYTVSDCSHNEIYEASINLVGSRRHGRKHRQIGTRVFRISDPHTTSVSPSLFSHSTTSLSNQHVTVTNHWAGNQNNLNDSYKTDIYRNNNNNRNPYQISERKEHSTSGYFLGGNSSPQYPTAYRNLERPNSKSTPQTNDYSDEVYDPWAFSKTHSQRLWESRGGQWALGKAIGKKEREYRCLGQWEENGRMFTYTQRRDVGSFECFVGSILSDTEIFIKEAGDHCQRDVDPMQHGMKLTRLGIVPFIIGTSHRLRANGGLVSTILIPATRMVTVTLSSSPDYF